VSEIESAEQLGRRATQQARSRRTRKRILEHAAAVFARDGYQGASLNRIVRESGLTKGAFYFHFESKEALALATFRYLQERFLGRMLEHAGDREDGLAALAELLRTRARLLREEPMLEAVLRIGAELGAEAGPASEFRAFQDLTLGQFAELVGRGQAEGVIRSELDPQATAELIFAAMVGTDRVSRLVSERADLEERTEHLIEVLANGLRNPSPATRKPGSPRA
jgi:TetR/AcrR family transcriptional repressor of uid operon